MMNPPSDDAKHAEQGACIEIVDALVTKCRTNVHRRCSNESMAESCSSDTPMTNPTAVNHNHKTTANNNNPSSNTAEPMSLIGLVQARRSSMPHAAARDLQAATTCLSLESTASTTSTSRRKFPRRSSHVSDMMLAKSQQYLEAAALGYGDDEPQSATSAEAAALGYGDDEPSEHQPPTKRPRRYHRRNSFVVPETSRAAGQTQSTFSWNAMDFLYGRSKEERHDVVGSREQALRDLGMPSLLLEATREVASVE